MNERLRPQPAPVADASSEVWPTIFGNVNLCLPAWLEADMRARHELGRKKYGVSLQVTNGRNPLRDAYEEVLDLLAYTQQARMRLKPATLKATEREWNARLALDAIFHQSLTHARWLGELLQSPASLPEPLR